ncbi:MAG TPA: hypothetical protein VK907_00150 [Phnomibacter sp.]|nr:hypothetical protein [Phnomibacter sp.]
MGRSSIQTENNITKFQVTIRFDMDEEFMTLVPAHRTYINYLINKGVIDSYAVSLESQKSWILINAVDKKEVFGLLERSPLYRYWTIEVDELYIFDGQNYRLPALQLN